MLASFYRRKEIIFLGVILFIAAYLRLSGIYERATFLGDEGRDALVVRQMIVNKRPTLLGPSTSVGNMYLGPIYYYFMIPALLLANFNPIGPAIMVALFGIATVYLLYYFTKTGFGQFSAFASAALYAVSNLIIQHTRFSWNPNPMPFFALLALIALTKIGASKKKTLWFLALGVSLGICFQLHYLSTLLVPFVFIFLATTRQLSRRYALILLAGIILPLSPLVLFEFRHQFVVSKSLWQFLSVEKKFGFSFSDLFTSFSQNYLRLFQKFMAFDSPRLGLGLALVSLLSLPLAFARPREKKFAWLVFLWLGIGLLGASFYREDVHDHYLGFLFPAPFILFGLFLAKIKHRFRAGFLLATIFLGYLFSENLKRTDVIADRGKNFQIPRAQVIGQYLAQDNQGEKFNLALISPTHDFRAMNYRYFTSLYGANAEGFENYSNIETLYVIIEHELATPTDLVAWEIASFGQAETVSEEVFDFGFRVLKMKKI